MSGTSSMNLVCRKEQVSFKITGRIYNELSTVECILHFTEIIQEVWVAFVDGTGSYPGIFVGKPTAIGDQPQVTNVL